MRLLLFLSLPLLALADSFSVERFFSADGQLESALVKFFDQEGRISEESLYGNLSGAFTHKLTFAASGLPQEPYESYSKRYTYGNKGQLLRIREDDGNCLENLWSEDKKTLLATFTMRGRRILLRTFFEGGRTIWDDGSSSYKDNLDGATYRDILETRKDKYEIEERKLALDLSSGIEVLQNRTVTNLDAQGKPAAKCIYSKEGVLLSKELYHYEGDKLRSYTDACQNTTQYHYQDGILVKQLGPETGCERCLVYDQDQKLVEIQVIQDGKLLGSELPPHRLEPALAYTARKQPSKINTPDGICQLRYSLSGKLLSEAWENGRQRIYTYTELNQQRSCTDIQHGGELQTTTYTYKGNRLVGKKTDRSTKCYEHDPFGGISKTTTEWPDGLVDELQFVRGARSEVLEKTRGSFRTLFSYDNKLRLLSKKRFHLGHLESELDFEYDAASNITERIDNGLRTATFYDALARPVRHFDKAAKLTTYEYQPCGKITHLPTGLSEHSIKKDQNTSWSLLGPNSEILWSLDKNFSANGWTEQESILDKGIPVITRKRKATLGPSGHLLSFSDGSLCEFYSYDHFGRLSQTRQQDGPALQRTYDPRGRLESLIASDNSIHYKFNYEPQATVTHALVSNHLFKTEWDCRNNLIYDGGCELAHDLFGKLESCFFAEGCGFQYSYSGNRLSQVRYIHDGKVLVAHPFSEYILGGLCKTQGDGEIFIYNEEGQPVETPAYRVLTAGPTSTHQPADIAFKDICSVHRQRITYDANTCIRSQTCPETGLPKLICVLVDGSIIRKKNESTLCYFDKRSRLIRKEIMGKIQLFSYDALDRCVRFEQVGEFSAHHTYDAQNRRVATKLVQGKKTHYYNYCFLDQYEVACFDEDKLVSARLLHPISHETLYIFTHNTLWRSLQNPAGSPCLLRSLTGRNIQSYRYDLEGHVVCYDSNGTRLDQTQTLSPWLFQGRRLEVGGYYLDQGKVLDPDL